MARTTPKNYGKSRLGMRFEGRIINANRQYRATGQARIEKQATKMAKIRGEWKHAEKGPPDFMGCLSGGRFIAFDAKSTKQKSFNLKKLLLRLHQYEFLKEVNKLGGIGFFLCEFETEERFFVLTIEEVEEALERAAAGGRQSISIDEMKNEVKGSFQSALHYLEPWGLEG